MKFCYGLLLIILLQSCQSLHNHTYDEAASYNASLGLAYLKQGDRPRAKRKLLKALAQAPNSPSVNTAMAYFMEKTGEITSADFFYKKAILADSKQGASFNNYGTFLCRHGQRKEAERYFLKAAQNLQYEQTAQAYENAGLCAQTIPDYPKAVYYFKKALQADPLRQQARNELQKIKKQQKN